jgi:hypothetical protein
MGFWTAEEVLVPARFLALTAHFVAVVTILMDKVPSQPAAAL